MKTFHYPLFENLDSIIPKPVWYSARWENWYSFKIIWIGGITVGMYWPHN